MSAKTIKFDLVKITPETAKEWIKNNTKNRKLRKRVVAGYVSEMKRGQWQTHTAEPIKLDHYGNILDGQHRLTAIIESGVTLEMWVASNVPEEAFHVIDTGLKRTGGDTLYVSGVKNPNAVSSMIRGYLGMKRGRFLSKEAAYDLGIYNSDVITEYEKRPNFWQSTVLQINNWYVAFYRILKPSFIAAHFLTYRERDKDLAVKFFDKLTSGENLSVNSPIYKLRDILQRDKDSVRQLSNYAKSALMIKAWNAFRAGRSLERLTFDPKKEDMPKPH